MAPCWDRVASCFLELTFGVHGRLERQEGRGMVPQKAAWKASRGRPSNKDESFHREIVEQCSVLLNSPLQGSKFRCRAGRALFSNFCHVFWLYDGSIESNASTPCGASRFSDSPSHGLKVGMRMRQAPRPSHLPPRTLASAVSSMILPLLSSEVFTHLSRHVPGVSLVVMLTGRAHCNRLRS